MSRQIRLAPDQVAAPIASPAPAQTTEQNSALLVPPTEPTALTPQTVPSFDILRVEPDGSTLVAGKTTPLSEVELVARFADFKQNQSK
ncbi:MAG: hypothetical protein U5K75_04230 [Ahrensia sp.]|nr:hypothetical protein [Ahrensia sp.]